MTTVIRIDSNGNIEVNKTGVDDGHLVTGADLECRTTSHNIPDIPDNDTSDAFRVAITCHDESVTSQKEEFLSDQQRQTALRSCDDEPLNYTTSSSESIDTDVTLHPVCSYDVPPPPLPSSIPPTSVAMTSSTSLRPHTLSLQSGFQKDCIPSPLAVVLAPPSPYAASPVEILETTIVQVSPSGTVSSTKKRVDFNEAEQELVRRAFADEHFSSVTSSATVDKTNVTSSISSSSSSSSSDSVENKQTSGNPLTSSYLSLISSHGYSNRRQVVTAVRSLINKSSSLSSSSMVGNHHSNTVNDVESLEVRSELINLRSPGDRSTKYLPSRDIRPENTENTESQDNEKVDHIKATDVEEQVGSNAATNDGIDDLQTRLAPGGMQSSMTSQYAGGSKPSEIVRDSDVTIRMTSQDLVVSGAIKESQDGTERYLSNFTFTFT